MKKTMLLISATLATLLVGSAVAAARSLGPTAHATRVGSKIVLFKSVGGVRIGMTPKQVKRKLGKPSHTIRVGGTIAELEYRHGLDPIINIEFNTILKGDPANAVFGYAKKMHTSKGIRPGSSVKALKRAYGHHGLKRTGLGAYTIYKGHPGAPGERETDFGCLHGKIVDIGIQGVFKNE